MKFWRGQRINPILLMNRAGHRVMQRIGSNTLARSSGGGAGPCFYITSLSIGDGSNPDTTVVCFNENWQNCSTGWTFEKNPGVPFENAITPVGVGQPCIGFETFDGYEKSGVGPLDGPRANYTPGSCSKDGSSEPECQLPAITNRSVINRVWGPSAVRIGDQAVGDDTILVVFPDTAPAQTGTLASWRVVINAAAYVNPTNAVIVGNSIRLTLPGGDVSDTDVLTLSHIPAANNWSNAAQAIDGRYCWRFYDMPVFNAVGVSFWNREDEGPWMLNDKTGRWELQ